MASESNFTQMINDLKAAQESDHDNREMVKEADHFLNKRDGQWEPEIIAKFKNKPRYTFDECNPIVDDIMGEMEAMDFNIHVSPAGGDSSKKTAQQFEGIIRTIENISNARFVYNDSARIMVGTGLDGWRVVQDYRDDDTFQQDLLIKPIPDFGDAVWFDPNAVKRDMSDSEFAWQITSLSHAAYKKKYPKGSECSVSTDLQHQVYSYKKPHEVKIGEYLYTKEHTRELALMSNGAVYEINSDYRDIKDELQKSGVTEIRTRKRKYRTVYQKIFDGNDWLTDEQETVFCYIPIIPVFGNFRISEKKVIYWGIIEKLMDPQRVINYAQSRKIEEGALSPRGKYWATKDQATSPDVRATLRTLNTNADPVQLYDHAEGQPPPFYQGSPPSNPGLVETSQSAQSFIERTSGTFPDARGAAPAHRSGEAVHLLQSKSDNPKRKWFTAMEVGIQHTYRILVKAIPKVYDTQQEMILTGQDGSTEPITIRQKVRDEQTQKIIELNNLSKGVYETICTAGPAFQSRQQETATAITEMARIDPSILQLGGDILLSNINAPGMDKIAARKRIMMVMQGLIPQDQMTAEEKQIFQAANENKEMSPLDQANLMIAQAQAADIQGKNQERGFKLQLEEQKLQLKEMEIMLKDRREREQQVVDAVSSVVEQIKTQAETLKLIREAMGVDAVVSGGSMAAYNRQAQELNESITQQ